MHQISRRFVREFELDLTGLNVLTEAATGSFAMTAPVAAAAGARVFAVAKKNSYASAEKARRETRKWAKNLNVASRITFVSRPSPKILKQIDIVTNSGNVRPINAKLIRMLPDHAVISLMVEPWEVRPKDVDLGAGKKYGIATAGPNEHGMKINVFSYLEPLIRKVLREQGVQLRDNDVFIISCPEFRPFLIKTVRNMKSRVTTIPTNADVAILAVGHEEPVRRSVLKTLPQGCSVIQLWADIEGTRPKHLRWFPAKAPRRGHMGYLLSELGPEPALRLMVGGLKVGELLARARQKGLTARQAVRKSALSGFALPPIGW